MNNFIIKFLCNLETIILIAVTSSILYPLIKDFGKENPAYTITYDHILIAILFMAFYFICGLYIGKHKK